MSCADCYQGTLHTGTPTGTIETLYGLSTYIASPPSGTTPKGTIVIFPDAFGWKFNNNRILADNYASKGNFRVLLPDVFCGWDLNEEALSILDVLMIPKEQWGLDSLKKVWYALRLATMFIPFAFGCRLSVVLPRGINFIKQLRENEREQTKIGAAGFCWGGKTVFLLARDEEKTEDGKPLIDAGFAAHPSHISFPEDIDKVVFPLSIAAPSNDHHIKGEKLEYLKTVLEKKSKAECEVTVYEDATHGFAVRANPHVPKENQQGIEAEDQAISWFTKFLAA